MADFLKLDYSNLKLLCVSLRGSIELAVSEMRCGRITLCRYWSRWKDVLLIVMPDTVTAWHRAGFRLYWRWRSRQPADRPRITDEIHGLIQRLAAEKAD